MIPPQDNGTLQHIGTKQHSGRYPWGSGDNPEQRHRSFIATVEKLKKQGHSDRMIYEQMDMNSTEFRAAKSIAKNAIRRADEAQAQRLKATGMSNGKIGIEMGNKNESSVRALLDVEKKAKNDVLITVADQLKERVAEVKYLDVGEGNEHYIGVSRTRLKIAIAMLEYEGYKIHYIQQPQLGNPGKFTSVMTLAAPGVGWSEVNKNRGLITPFKSFSEDGGRTFHAIADPVSVSSSRVGVRYGKDGGSTKDGMIELRRGVPDISLGHSRYAQVRISVDDTHFIKGMAMYSDTLPKGVDILFNTNKQKPASGNKLEVLKSIKTEDPKDPYGSTIRQKYYVDKDGKKKLSPLNIVGSPDPQHPGTETRGEEGGWAKWSHDFSSQMLSKQTNSLAKERLAETASKKQQEYNEIMALTNPTIKKRLLEKFADGADSSALHLQAASLPRTSNHVILPINSLKDNEIYAPKYNNGEKVVLIRHPHGGIFEIPELTVNNRNKEAKSLIDQAIDAVGINSNVARRLSGADFDGDTVLVIPNAAGKIKTEAPISSLLDFDPQIAYPGFPGMKAMTKSNTQTEMGKISNLITDMTIRGANNNEIARAVRHSMVVIDAEKKVLNYQLSAKQNGIAALKKTYQSQVNAEGKTVGGASTIISKAKSKQPVLTRRLRPAKLGGNIDPATGKKMYETIAKPYTDKHGKPVLTKFISTKMAETDNAHTLSSGRPIEVVYANHANVMKAMANMARKSAYETPRLKSSPSAKKVFDTEVASLNAKLKIALRNAPLERQSQLIGGAVVDAKKQANPQLTGKEIQKIKGQQLIAARVRTKAHKERIDITPDEWIAIQAGAISDNVLGKILNNADLDQIKKLATPKTKYEVSTAMASRARAMLAAGHTQAEIAGALGVPVSTLMDTLSR